MSYIPCPKLSTYLFWFINIFVYHLCNNFSLPIILLTSFVLGAFSGAQTSQNSGWGDSFSSIPQGTVAAFYSTIFLN